MARDREEQPVPNGGDEWRMAWHPPGAVPPGTPHGANAFCVTAGGDVVLISSDGSRWGWPGGRPERGESWEDTLRREMLEEACAEVRRARLLGWQPEFEIPFRRVVPARDLALHLWMEDGAGPVYSRAAREAELA